MYEFTWGFFIKIPKLERLQHLAAILLFSSYHMKRLKNKKFSSPLTIALLTTPSASLWEVPPRRPMG